MKIIGIIFITILVIAGIVFGLAQRSRIGQREIERWETTNRIFKIRVTAHPEENGGIVGGAYYVFWCAREDGVNWREIMTVRHDDPVKIPREQVRFISDEVGYVFMLYHYGVTIDGGVTWSVWYAPENLPYWRQTRATIDDVRLVLDGTGTMALRSSTDQTAPELHTSDFGKHWNPR